MEVSQKTLSINVSYDLSIKELVKANKFDGYVNKDVNDNNFPIKKGKPQKREAVLLGFEESVSTEEVLETMKQMNLEPGTLQELLSLGVDHPNLQKKNPILALGQTCRDQYGSPFVPCLDWYDGRRLCLFWVDRGWDSRCRFLAFRKS